jgi:ribosomal-protein-alanine N-acetyltransferase
MSRVSTTEVSTARGAKSRHSQQRTQTAMLSGAWFGTLEAGSARLRMKLIIDDDRGATLFSLDQGGQPILGTMAPERIEFEFPSVHGQFIGRQFGLDRIEGFWLQNGRDRPLLLQRVVSTLPDPAPSAPVTSERIAELRAEVGSPTIIETDRLILREVRADDLDAFRNYMLPEAYWRHDPRTPPTAESVGSLVEWFMRSQSEKPRMDYFLAAVDKSSDEFVGEASIRVRRSNARQGAIGYGVVSSRWGQGLATEIGRGLLRLAFNTLDLHRVDGQCKTENQASRRVMTKLGMREEGVFRDNLFVRGEWWSTAQFAVISTD